ncbi:hypothetical protein D3C81_1588020 [compost metagenome]
MFSSRMPKATAAALLLDTAMKCLYSSASEPPWARYQARAAWAFFRVSRVLNDLDETMNSVVSARSLADSSWNSLPSMFAR